MDFQKSNAEMGDKAFYTENNEFVLCEYSRDLKFNYKYFTPRDQRQYATEKEDS